MKKYERSNIMQTFYFTYGTDPAYPFQGGWTEIKAPDRPSACKAFQIFHPNREGSPNLLNCADIYPQEQFLKIFDSDGNFGAFCHEVIILTRELTQLESRGC